MSNVLYEIIDEHTEASQRSLDKLDQWLKNLDRDALTIQNFAGTGGTGRFFQAETVAIGEGDGVKVFNPDNGQVVAHLDTAGNAWFGPDVETQTTTFFLNSSGGDVSLNSELISHGDLLVGRNVSGAANMLFDYSAGQLKLRTGQTDGIVLDTDGSLYSGNYSSGITGWKIDKSGDAEFNDLKARGSFKASVFEVGEITATAGSSGVFHSATQMYADKTFTSSSGSFTVENAVSTPTVAPVSTYDWLRIKTWNGSEIVDLWMRVSGVTASTGYSTVYYTTTTDLGWSSGLQVYKGVAVIVYGPDQGGYLMQSADGTFGEAVNFSIATYAAGVPTAVTVATGGTGYSVGNILTCTEAGSGANTLEVEVLTVDGSGGVLTVSIDTAGYGYVTAGDKSCSGGDGSGCYITVNTISGPWDTQTLQARLGNLYGSYGAGSNNYYGIGIGDYSSGDYMAYNADGGGTFELSAAGGAVTIDGGGINIYGDGAAGGHKSSVDFYTGASVRHSIYMTDLTALSAYNKTSAASKQVSTYLWSDADATYRAMTWVRADSGSSTATIEVYADSDNYTGINHNAPYHDFYDTPTGDTMVTIQGDLSVAAYTGLGKITTDGDVKAGNGIYVGSSSGTADQNDITYEGNLKSRKSSVNYDVYGFHPLTTILTNATYWQGYARSTTSATTIDMSAVFGVPSNIGIKAYLMRIQCRDSGTHPLNGPYLAMGYNGSNWALIARPVGNDAINDALGIVPCTSAGDIQWGCNASGTGTLDVWAWVVGYFV